MELVTREVRAWSNLTRSKSFEIPIFDLLHPQFAGEHNLWTRQVNDYSKEFACTP